MNIHERQKQIEKLTRDADGRRKLADVDRQRAGQYENDDSGKQPYFEAAAMKAEHDADEMEEQAEQERQALVVDEAKLTDLQQQREQEMNRHRTAIDALDRDINNLRGL